MDLPKSCRPWADINENSTSITDNDDIAWVPYAPGCIKHLSVIVHRSALYISTGAVAIALIQVYISLIIV